MMISIFLSINNNEEVIELPVIPADISLDSPFGNDTFESMNQELNLIGIRELRSLDIRSFFPVKDYPFLRNRSMWGMEYVEAIESWRDRRLPIRLVIANDDSNGFNLNMPVTIDGFTYSVGKSGDIDYTLSLREFAFVKLVD